MPVEMVLTIISKDRPGLVTLAQSFPIIQATGSTARCRVISCNMEPAGRAPLLHSAIWGLCGFDETQGTARK